MSLSLYQQLMIALIHEARDRKHLSTFAELILGRDSWSSQKQVDLCTQHPKYAHMLLAAYVDGVLEESPQRTEQIMQAMTPIIKLHVLEALTCPEDWIRRLAQQIYKEQNNVESSDQL